jgi:hypothetical protein
MSGYQLAVVVDAESKKTSKSTLRSERGSALKNNLTGPTMFDMSGDPTIGGEWAFNVAPTRTFRRDRFCREEPYRLLKWRISCER